MNKFYTHIRNVLVSALVCSQGFSQSPNITNFTPSLGTVGTLVTITGTDLSNPVALSIGGVTAVPVSNDGNIMVAMVMPGAVTGDISITTAGGTATTGSFTVKKANAPNIQQARLVGTGNISVGHQGQAVAVSADGNTVVVGAPEDNGTIGAIWIFTRTASVWSQQGNKLIGIGVGGGTRFGCSVAISADGNTVIAGGTGDAANNGAAWIFTRSGGVWTQQGNKLVGAGFTGTYRAGWSVALSADGNTAMVGAPNYGSNRGTVYVYIRNALGVWSQQGANLQPATIVGVSADFGRSVSLSADGNTALIGGFSDNWNLSTSAVMGAAWIFIRTAGVWTQQAKLVGTGVTGTQGSLQGAGVSISADGNTALVGGTRDNNSIGAAWVFTRSGTVWTQQGGKLVGTGNILQSEQGNSVALSADGNIAMVGGWMDRSTPGGAVWVFKRSAGVWTQHGSKLLGTGGSTSAWQGSSVSLSADGSTLLSGAFSDNSTGASYVFQANPVTLPVRWLTFDAAFISGSEVKVSWSTATEMNNASFNVQRSADGSFNQFTTVGTIKGNGTSNIVSSYQLTDKYSFASGQSYYYRIKQVDMDDRSTYSPIIRVKSAADLQNTTWQIYPNPVGKNKAISLVATGGNIHPGEMIQVQLINSMGQVIGEVRDVIANATIRIGEQVQKLAPGVYAISIRQKSGNYSLRVVVPE